MDSTDVELPDVPIFPQKQVLAMEKEVLGLYISGHPLKEYEELLKEKVSHYTAGLAELADETNVIIGGVITKQRKITTRAGEPMVFIQLEDLLGTVEVIVFPRVYKENAAMIIPDAPILVRGRINFNTRDEQTKVIAEKLGSLEELTTNTQSPNRGLYIKVPVEDGEKCLGEIQGVLRRFSGNTPVYLYFESKKKVILTKRLWWVELDSRVIEELILLLGESCIHIKELA